MHYTKSKIFKMCLSNLCRENVNLKNFIWVLSENYDIALEQALKCNDWDFARRYVELSLTGNNDWDFARRYVELSLTGNISTNPNFLYEYEYPNDCLFAREILRLDDNVDANFEITLNYQGKKVINTNITPAVLRYTKFVNDESYFNSEFVLKVVKHLSDIAFQISEDIKNKNERAINVN